MAREVTIDDLAGMVKRGFDGADKRFNKVDEKLDQFLNLSNPRLFVKRSRF